MLNHIHLNNPTWAIISCRHLCRRRWLVRGPTLHPLAASGAIAADGVIAAGHHLGEEDVFHDAIMLLAMFLYFAIQSEMQHATILPKRASDVLAKICRGAVNSYYQSMDMVTFLK